MGSPSTEDEIDFLGLYPSGGWFCKYPNLVVSGDTVTQEQAEEIILRCSYNPVDFGNSDRRKAEFYQGIGLPLVDITDARDDEEEERIREAVETLRAYFKMRIKKSLRPLQLQYLNFDRITSCHYLGGSGIVDWNGTIRDTLSVGKWPCTFYIREDLEEIAKTFPYLKFSAQLYDETDLKPWTDFHVENGIVRVERSSRILFPMTLEEKHARVEEFTTKSQNADSREDYDNVRYEQEACVPTDVLFNAIRRVAAKLRDENPDPDE